MNLELTDEEKRLLSFALACYIDDAERESRKKATDHPFNVQLAKIQRLHIRINPGALAGDYELADGTMIRKGREG